MDAKEKYHVCSIIKSMVFQIIKILVAILFRLNSLAAGCLIALNFVFGSEPFGLILILDYRGLISGDSNRVVEVQFSKIF